MKKLVILFSTLFLSSCAGEDERILDYCKGITDTADVIIAMREQGLEKDAALALLENSDAADDKHTLAHMTRNIKFAYRYPNMPLEIYQKEVFNHCLASYRK